MLSFSVFSVQIISWLDSQSKFEMGNTLFSSCYIGAQQRLHQHGVYILFKLCKFLRNILTNICCLEKRTDLKLGEVSSLFIPYKITISWLYPLNGFWFNFFIVWQWKHLLGRCLLNTNFFLCQVRTTQKK